MKKYIEANKTNIFKKSYIIYSHLTYNITRGVTSWLGFTVIRFFFKSSYSYQCKKHNLHSIAKTIVLNNTNYILTAVVYYIQYNNNNGHYTALAYAGTHWYEYDDLKKKSILL